MWLSTQVIGLKEDELFPHADLGAHSHCWEWSHQACPLTPSTSRHLNGPEPKWSERHPSGAFSGREGRGCLTLWSHQPQICQCWSSWHDSQCLFDDIIHAAEELEVSFLFQFVLNIFLLLSQGRERLAEGPKCLSKETNETSRNHEDGQENQWGLPAGASFPGSAEGWVEFLLVMATKCREQSGHLGWLGMLRFVLILFHALFPPNPYSSLLHPLSKQYHDHGAVTSKRFSFTTVLCNMREIEKERIDEACKEVSKSLNLLGMADGQNDGKGMHSKDHTRRWTTVSDVDMLVLQPRKQGKQDKSHGRGNRNWQL